MTQKMNRRKKRLKRRVLKAEPFDSVAAEQNELSARIRGQANFDALNALLEGSGKRITNERSTG